MYPIACLQFWVKDYKNKPLTILEVIKETLGFILKIRKKIARWHHSQKISIKSMKTTISQLFLHFWSQHGYQKKQKTSRNAICWFDPQLFNQNWINFEKPSKKCWFLCTFMVFQEFFNREAQWNSNYYTVQRALQSSSEVLSSTVTKFKTNFALGTSELDCSAPFWWTETLLLGVSIGYWISNDWLN